MNCYFLCYTSVARIFASCDICFRQGLGSLLAGTSIFPMDTRRGVRSFVFRNNWLQNRRYTAAKHSPAANNTHDFGVGSSLARELIDAKRWVVEPHLRFSVGEASSISTQKGTRRKLLAARAVARSASVRHGGTTRNAPSCSAPPCHTSWSPRSEPRGANVSGWAV